MPHPVFDYDGYGYLAQEGLVSGFEVDSFCQTVGFFPSGGIGGGKEEDCGDEKAHFSP